MKLYRPLIPRQLSSIKVAAIVLVAAVISITFSVNSIVIGEEPGAAAKKNLTASESEAAGRARWLHEIVHGALQVMHRDFFGDGDDDGLSLPSQSLEDVFKEMSRSWSVDIRWLGGNATQDEEHEAEDYFERDAVKALISGKTEYSKVEGNKFRFVGAITLHNQCLKCHVPLRKSLEERVAGLSITMPIKSSATKGESKKE